ncbi:MAG: NAD(P) transhydrogenase subunit alpha [Gemmataceae bacterium]
MMSLFNRGLRHARTSRMGRPAFLVALVGALLGATPPLAAADAPSTAAHPIASPDMISMAFVFMLATFIGIGVIRRVSRLLHTPLMSLTNAISAICVVGAIIVAGGEHYSTPVRVMGAIALFASMTNIISGFLITDRMLKMFKTREGGKS